MPQRSQLIPWKSAGRVTEQFASGDEVVRRTGWVFNNATGNALTLADFVATGDDETPTYLSLFELVGEQPSTEVIVEIGSGIGRMTCALTREFGTVVACDLDAGFLERCREVVARFGRPERLRTSQVADGRTLDLADDSADVVFSYITLQHCQPDDARSLIAESIRVARPGARIALNLRSRSLLDTITMPIGAVIRLLFRIPVLGGWLSTQRLAARLAWQANRISPSDVMNRVGSRLSDPVIWTHPGAALAPGLIGGVSHRTFPGINRHHWWLVGTVTG
jgi:ubiquinone/menaquinone biosynthesis C-methylase UbiE